MSSSPRPQYFVAREDGTLTPLIAVDELPSSVNILGVPATMTHADTQNMVSLGLRERCSQRYVVSSTDRSPATEAVSATTRSSGEIKISAEQQPSARNTNGPVENGGTGKATVEKWRRGVKVKRDAEVDTAQVNGDKESESSEEVDEEVNVNRPKPSSPREFPRFTTAIPSHAGAAGAGTKGTLGRKLYCTHWIRWGECDYTQQGCLYKHEMPDEKTLHEIGIATYPRWYRIANPEKFGGITEVPEWHRRPGPAPTDQLWRGGAAAVAARAIAPQSWEEFRQNSKLASVPRYPNQVGQSNGAAGPNPVPNPFFTLNNYSGTFNPWNGSFVQQQQASRSQYPKAPFPRVINVDSSFINRSNQKPVNASVDAQKNISQPSSIGTRAKDQANHAVTAEKTSSNSESNSTTTQQFPSDAQAPDTPAPPTLDTATGVTTENPLSTPVVNLPKTSTPEADDIAESSVSADNPTSPDVLSAIDKVHRPLVPSPVPQGSAAVNGNTQEQNEYKKPVASFVEAPKTPPPIHRRFFVPAGESRFVANKQVDPPEKEATTNSAAGKPRQGKHDSRMSISGLNLLDLEG